MEENKLPIEVKADLTKTIENAYNDTLKEPLSNTSGVVSTVLNFFHNTVLYPLQKYNLYAENKLQNYAIELENRAQKIPAENLVNPRINILGPAIEGLKYNLDEEYIKEMFTNILISDMDSRKQNKVLPSYIEFIKQLSSDDARFLKLLSEERKQQYAILQLEVTTSSGGYYCPSNDIFLIKENESTLISSIITDNLSRLKIINIDFLNFIKNEEIYNKVFDELKENSPLAFVNNMSEHLSCSKGILKITDLGKNFIDICLS